MQTLTTPSAMQALADELRASGKKLALVPTMGALHDGHMALVREARRRADHVTVSIFVNPTQFGPGEDFEKYPRDLRQDSEALAAVGADVIFAPTVQDMYPDGGTTATWIEVQGLDRHLCGAFRPGHFRGVTTVVGKLLNIARPHVAVFGLKDAQQYLILRRMVQDLNMGVELFGVPIVRESDGLARSSRNVYLSPEERSQAVVLSQAVNAARTAVEEGEQRPEVLVEIMRKTVEKAPLARIQYIEVVDTGRIEPLKQVVPGSELLAALAVHFGSTRLIDNVFVKAPFISSGTKL